MKIFFEPTLEDQPLDALKKAKRSFEAKRAHKSLKQVRLKDDANHYFIYRKKGEKLWVAPEIRYKWVAQDSDIEKLEFIRLLNNAFRSNNDPHNVDRLYTLLENNYRQNKIILR